MSFKPIDIKRDEFRKYLERTGVLDALSKVLVKLYEINDKPENAIDFLRHNIGDSLLEKDTIDSLRYELAELKLELAELKSGKAPVIDKVPSATTTVEEVQPGTSAIVSTPPAQPAVAKPEEPQPVIQEEIAKTETEEPVVTKEEVLPVVATTSDTEPVTTTVEVVEVEKEKEVETASPPNAE